MTSMSIPLKKTLRTENDVKTEDTEIIGLRQGLGFLWRLSWGWLSRRGLSWWRLPTRGGEGQGREEVVLVILAELGIAVAVWRAVRDCGDRR
jgi:hypothetical protein